MTPRLPRPLRSVPVAVLGFALLPALVLAQAGLSGDPFSGQAAERLGLGNASKWDNGSLRGTSALGQLEQISGGKVVRPSNQRSALPRAVAQPRAAVPRFDANQYARNALAGALVGALFDSIFNDNSAQQRAAAEAAAAEAAARAAAEAEAFRVQQELARQARIRQAQHFRADWDSREGDITDRLSDAFGVSPGTAFFGRPANPDAETVAEILGQEIGDATDSDTSVVDLRGSSLVVPIVGQPVAAGTTPGLAVRPPSRGDYDLTDDDATSELAPSSSPVNGFVNHVGSWVGEGYEDFAESTVKETLWGLAENVRGQKTAKALVEFREQQKDMTEKLNESYARLMELIFGGATNAVHILGSGNTGGGEYTEEYWKSLPQRARAETLEYYKMVYGQVTGKAGAPDLGG